MSRLLLYLAILCLVLGISTSAWATTYYVATTGSNSNSCVQSQDITTPKLTVAAGIACLQVDAPGNTLYIRAGNYNENIDSNTQTIPIGTASAYTRIAAYPGEAVIVHNLNLPGGYIHYLIIERLIMEGAPSPGFGAGTGVSIGFYQSLPGVHHVTLLNCEVRQWAYNGINFADRGTHHLTMSGGSVHHIGNPGAALAELLNGHYGIYQSGPDALIENVDLYNVLDYGIHNSNSVANRNIGAVTDRTIVRNNKVHNVGINPASGSPATASHAILLGAGDALQGYNNLVYSNGRGGIQIGGTNIGVYNNTIVSNTGAGIKVQGTGAILRNNIIYQNTAPIIDQGVGTIQDHNFTTDPLFVNAGAQDFHLQASSGAINAGINVGLPFNGSAPDDGAFETIGSGSIGFSSATITDVTMDVTLAMNLNVPLLPASGITGFTIGCTGANCGTPVVSNASRLTGSDSIIRLVTSGWGGSGVCEVGETITVAYTPGNVTDSIGQALGTFTSQSVTNACGTPPPPPPGGPYIFYKLNDNTGTNANDETTNNLDGTLTNGPTWVTGKSGFAVHFADQVNDYIAVPYGASVNPSTQSLTFCLGVLPDVGLESAGRIFFGSSGGSSQRLYLGTVNRTFAMGIQGSSKATNNEFTVTSVWTRICLRMDSATDTATLFKNGVKGTSAESVKAYTSYTLVDNVRLGQRPNDVTAELPGVTLDEFKVWQSALTDQQILDDFNAWEPPSPPLTCTLAQVADQKHLLRQTSGGAVQNWGAQSATVPVVAGGAFMLTTQTDATVAGCNAAERLRYNINGGAFLEVPNVMGPDGVAFYGTPALTDPDILKGAVTTLLTGALTKIDGATQYLSDAVPVISFTQNSSTPQRSVIKFNPAIAPGTTVCFKRYTQQSQAYSAYTPSAGACVTIMAMNAGTGF
jgi:hypothetical protein